MKSVVDYSGLAEPEAMAKALADVKFYIGSGYQKYRDNLADAPAENFERFGIMLGLIVGIEGFWPVRAFYHDIWPEAPMPEAPPPKWKIVNTAEVETMFWSNEHGWCDEVSQEYDTFTDEQKRDINLPVDGAWVRDN